MLLKLFNYLKIKMTVVTAEEESCPEMAHFKADNGEFGFILEYLHSYILINF